MAPSKPRNNDDSKPESNHKEKVSKKKSKDTPVILPPSKAATPEKSGPATDWSSFDRESLENYRRHHNLDTPAPYLYSSYYYWIAVPGSIGMYSPTMVNARRRRASQKYTTDRQTKEQLAVAVQKHFDVNPINENDVIVDFISNLRQEGTRPEIPAIPIDPVFTTK